MPSSRRHKASAAAFAAYARWRSAGRPRTGQQKLLEGHRLKEGRQHEEESHGAGHHQLQGGCRAVVHAETDANCDGEVDSRHMSWQLGEGVQLGRHRGSPDHSSGPPLRRGRQGSTGCGRHVPASGREQRATWPVARSPAAPIDPEGRVQRGEPERVTAASSL